MKIKKVTPEYHAKVYALLRAAFVGSEDEAQLVQQLHEKGRALHEWVCLHTNKAIAYIAFSNAYQGRQVCGLHLAPMAVAPAFQKQGVGAELLRFALRQEAIKQQPLFVLGPPAYYSKFGFEPCRVPVCAFDQNNAHFLSLRNTTSTRFVVGYEPEFEAAAPTRPTTTKGRRRR